MEKFLKFPISGSTYQLVSVTGVVIVEQTAATTTTIAYKAGNASGDILTITHGSVSNDDFRDFVQLKRLYKHLGHTLFYWLILQLLYLRLHLHNRKSN